QQLDVERGGFAVVESEGDDAVGFAALDHVRSGNRAQATGHRWSSRRCTRVAKAIICDPSPVPCPLLGQSYACHCRNARATNIKKTAPPTPSAHECRTTANASSATAMSARPTPRRSSGVDEAASVGGAFGILSS